MDGKEVRGASKQTDEGRRMMVAAVEHGSALVLGQKEIDDKTNEVPVVRELSSSLDLAGRTVTLDAMHAQHDTARCLLDHCHADYVVGRFVRRISATRQGWSRRSGVCDDFMKPCLSSSGCETRPAKGEPARAGSEPCAGDGNGFGDA